MLRKLITGFSATILLAAQALAQTPGTITLDDGTPIRLPDHEFDFIRRCPRGRSRGLRGRR